ncbi:type I secretion system permease/ATPase [Ruegeria lacuscaerulensis]|uniref:type I secretion system permease/ATPase n=1 Tax=Ruegeria lacuscaerulensis TaxID=55218 RepID=UPI00147EC8BE
MIVFPVFTVASTRLEEADSHRVSISLAAAKSRDLLLIAMAFSIFTNLLMLTGPVFMLQIYDRVLSSRSEETLLVLFGLVTLLFTIYGFLEYARGRVSARIGARIQSTFGPLAFKALLERSALKRSSGIESHGLQDIEALKAFFSSPLLLAIFDLPWTPIFLVAVFIFHPYLGWLALAGGCVLVSAALINQILTVNKTLQAQSISQSANRFAGQVQEMSDLAWSQGMASDLEKRWKKLQDAALHSSILANDWTGGFASFSKAFRFFLQAAMLGLGAWLVLQNELTAGAMIASSILLGRALAPIEQCIPQWSLAQKARRGWRRLDELLQELKLDDEVTTLPKPEASLTVDGVTVFARGREHPVLGNVSFHLAPGEALGILGKSGSGKSTLARVVMGLVSPHNGEVRLGGATLKQYGPEEMGKQIGYLPQDVHFFAGTIAENIAQMSLEVSPERVVIAAKRAKVHSIILNLDEGYNTVIEPLDDKLSGGQKQRLALARALYGDPKILVLDEPNSALDKEGSDALNAVVSELKAANKSVLIMTHRPVAISECDKLLILQGGQTKDYGPRDQVLGSSLKNVMSIKRQIQANENEEFRSAGAHRKVSKASKEFRSIRKRKLGKQKAQGFKSVRKKHGH